MSSTIHSSKEPAYDAKRFRILLAFLCLVGSILIARIWWLQVKNGEHYLRLSASNFLQERRIPHRRGLIYDTSGEILVDNRASHDLYIIAAFLPDSLKTLRKVFKPLRIDSAYLKVLDKRLLAGIQRNEEDLLIATDVSGETCNQVLQLAHRLDAHGVHARWQGNQDREGCELSLRLDVFPSRASIFLRLQEILEISDDDWQKRLKKSLRYASGLRKFKPVLLLEDVGFTAYAKIRSASSLGELPGILLQDSQRRRSLVGATGAHILGFMNEMTQKEFSSRKDEGYHLGDLIGRRGVERSFEKTLHGKDGTRRVVVDAKGRSKGEKWAKILLGDARRTPPIAGKSLVLSLDMQLQKTAEQAFLGKAGSVVAVEAKTGFVLALASFPTFDPNIMTGRASAKEWQRVLKDPLRPLTNKAIQEHYAPGSTFKAITAVAGLSHGKITAHTHKNCPGYFRLGRTQWRCYNRGGHGSIALENALKKSCDTYFYSLGYALGPENLATTARAFGFGSRTGIPIGREIPGIMPDLAYYKKHFGVYTPGLVVNSSIGQGDVTVTPLQLAMAYSAIANGGLLYRPQIVRAIVNDNGVISEEFGPDLRWPLDVPEEGLLAVKHSLSFVTEKGGTASGIRWRRDMPKMSKWVREGGIVISGKTGTAQVVRLAKNVAHLNPKDVEYAQRDHAWFVGFAPVDDPEIVVVVMTEHGGFGGSMSAPVVAELMRVYFERGGSSAIFVEEGQKMGQHSLENDTSKAELNIPKKTWPLPQAPQLLPTKPTQVLFEDGGTP